MVTIRFWVKSLGVNDPAKITRLSKDVATISAAVLKCLMNVRVADEVCTAEMEQTQVAVVVVYEDNKHDSSFINPEVTSRDTHTGTVVTRGQE